MRAGQGTCRCRPTIVAHMEDNLRTSSHASQHNACIVALPSAQDSVGVELYIDESGYMLMQQSNWSTVNYSDENEALLY